MGGSASISSLLAGHIAQPINNMSMKTAQEARKGDRVWLNHSALGEVCLIEAFIQDPGLYDDDDLGYNWGYLADNETVIGGQLIKPLGKGSSWLIDIYSIPTDSILGGGAAFTKCTEYFRMSDNDKSAIQAHVFRNPPITITHWGKLPQSDKPKRTAKDAKVGDDVWVLNKDTGDIVVGLIKNFEVGNYLEIRADGRVFSRYFEQFGVTWGFPETKPEQSAISPFEAAIQEHVGSQPKHPTPAIETAPKSNPDSDGEILARKGAQWVRINRPDIWKRLKADLLEKTRREGDKLAKPGILAGKFASPY